MHQIINHTAGVISVGLSSYNRPDLLRRAIASIKNQKNVRLEILISDNGSNKKEVHEIIEKFAAEDVRVKQFLHLNNKGAFFNFRFLLEQATGEYFIWLADDDYWSENFLSNIIRQANQSRAALTYGKTIVVDVDMLEVERQGKELISTRQRWLSLARFTYFDTDSIIYGLFRTEVGQQLTPLLKEWNFSPRILEQFPYLAYNFPSYPFVYGLLASGGFCNASSEEATHFVGGRAPYENKPKLTVHHVALLCAYLSMHAQMMWRYMRAAFTVRCVSGVAIAPMSASYLLIRRLWVALRNRKNRMLN
jgi:GalNAc5-diNAcBac-PP-undecaprenol beta-1,3-glucosyltransferase